MAWRRWLNIGIVLVLIIIEGVFVAAEIALVSLRESQVRALAEDGRRAAPRVRQAGRRPEPLPGRRADRRHLDRAAVQRVRRGHAVRRGQGLPRRARLGRGAGRRHRHRRRHADHLVRDARARRTRAQAAGPAAGRDARPSFFARRSNGIAALLPAGHLAAVASRPTASSACSAATRRRPARADHRGGAARPGRRARVAGQRRAAPDRRRVRRRRARDRRGDGAAHRGHLPRRRDDGQQGGEGGRPTRRTRATRSSGAARTTSSASCTSATCCCRRTGTTATARWPASPAR